MDTKIKAGIIGVSPERGWASIAHIPAIKALPQFELSAISSRNPDTASAAGRAFDVPHVYHTTEELVNSPQVELVIVTVKVPLHRELVEAAVNARKDVFCEWPLGKNLQEATLLASLVKEKGVHGFVGLQSRAAPAINYIRDLIAAGYVGEILSTSLIGAGILYGAFTEQVSAYAVDVKNGAGMIYSTFGNTIDALCYCMGEFSELNATAITRRRETVIIETGETIPMTAFDQIAVNGILENGAVATVHFRGGMFKGTNFFWEINGTKGDLVITAGGEHPGVFELTIKGGQGDSDLVILPIPAKYYNVDKEAVQGPAYTVAENYARLANDLANGTHSCATFDDALIRHRMIHAIETAAATGERQHYTKQ